MPDATFRNVTSFDGRRFHRGGWRIRFLVGGVVVLGTVAAFFAVVTIVTAAAAWIVHTALAPIPLLANRPTGPAALALADPEPMLARAADITGSIWTSNLLPPPRRVAEPAIAPAPEQTRVAVLTESVPLPALPLPPLRPLPPLPPAAPEKRAALPPADKPLPEAAGRTAVYDIAAHTVYLPNGKKLEAHSGLGDKLDDPRYVSVRMRGPTPPNVYELALREPLFHDVRAIRLKPVGSNSMFGRDGMLAHTYMLGPNGQSNGCVSFKDYPVFLHAYLNGEVDRLVVVPHLGNTPWRTAAARGGVGPRYADNNP